MRGAGIPRCTDLVVVVQAIVDAERSGQSQLCAVALSLLQRNPVRSLLIGAAGAARTADYSRHASRQSRQIERRMLTVIKLTFSLPNTVVMGRSDQELRYRRHDPMLFQQRGRQCSWYSPANNCGNGENYEKIMRAKDLGGANAGVGNLQLR